MTGASAQDSMLEPLASLVVRGPVTCREDLRLQDALEAMRVAKVGSIVIVDAAGSPRGIFTERDLLRLAASGTLDTDAPVGRFMTPDPASLPASAVAYDAALLMARKAIRHLLVLDRGALLGVVSERSLFALQRRSMRHVIHAIELAQETASLERAAAGIREFDHSLLAQGIAAEQLTRIVVQLNDRLTERIVALEAARHDLGGIRWCWLALGSEGREEQTFSTDQDNAIVFESSGNAEDARARLLPFARNVNATLAACGFPLCPGNVMAGNPQCCLSTEEWHARFAAWVRTPTPQALLDANIYFDFRGIAGEAALASNLRAWLRELVSGQEMFFRMLAFNVLDTPAPLGLFGFVTGGEGRDAGTIDLKAQGTRLITDAARVYAMSRGVEATNTATRLREAARPRGMGEEEVEAIIGAFYRLLAFRFHPSGGRTSSARSPNRIAPRELNEFDRRMLKESLRQAKRLQQRLALDYRR